MNMIQQSLMWLDKQEEHDRLANYDKYENYYNGKYDLMALLPTKIKETLMQELSIADNICKSIVDAKTQYLCAKPCSIIVTGPPGGDPDDPKIKEAERDLYHIYNHEFNGMLQENMGKLISITGKKGDSFVKVYQDLDIPTDSEWGVLDQIQIRVINPACVFPKYKEEDYHKLEYVIIETESEDEEGVPMMKAQIFYPDHVEFYELYSTNNSNHSEWTMVDDQPNPDNFIPIQHIKNNASDCEFGISDLMVVTDFQDAINKTITDMMVTLDNTAFQRLFISGAASKPGKPINMSPGSIVELLQETSTVTAIEPGDISALLNALEKLIDNAYMIAQIPKIVLGKVEGGIPSGYALRIHYLPLENKCAIPKEIIRNQFRSLNNKIFKMIKRLTNGAKDYTGYEATIEFQSGLPIDSLSTAQETIMLKDAKLISQETAMQRNGIEDTEEEKRRIENESMAEEAYGVGRVNAEAGAVAQALQNATITTEAQPAGVPPSQQP